MRKETVDIIGDLVSSMNFTFVAKTIINNGGTYTFTTCNTYHLQECFKITIDNAIFKITEVIKNESITIKPVLDSTPAPTLLEFSIYNPYYFHGTVIQTNLELEQITNSSAKTPMIYLLEVAEDKFFNDDSSLERESDLRLFFLTQANFVDWKTQDTYENAINPMRSLLYSFIETLNNSKIVGKFNDYRVINHTKFGVYMTDKGYEKRIFNDNLAGVELRISLPILQSNKCESNC